MWRLDLKEQYLLGLQAGVMLRTTHSLKHVGKEFAWSNHYRDRVISKIESYRACDVKIVEEDTFVKWIAKYEHVLN